MQKLETSLSTSLKSSKNSLSREGIDRGSCGELFEATVVILIPKPDSTTV
jgi:hypothetical protein